MSTGHPSGERWIVAASGPSMRVIPERPPGWRCIAVNSTWAMVPWADALYAGDSEWWAANADKLEQHRPAFRGQRFTRCPFAAQRHGAQLVPAQNGRGLCTKPGTINLGGNSGYQAVNLAYHWGAREIVLVGFDMRHVAGRAHWHPDHPGLNAPEHHCAVWVGKFAVLAHDLRKAGVRVTNATPGSALRCFPMAPFLQAVA